VDRFYAPSHDFGLRWDDPAIGIAWPIPASEAILSERDRKHPGIAELKSPFQHGVSP
jgi:dTDP-4-dehydrorhamnose 3,5-epimerase